MVGLTVLVIDAQVDDLLVDGIALRGFAESHAGDFWMDWRDLAFHFHDNRVTLVQIFLNLCANDQSCHQEENDSYS